MWFLIWPATYINCSSSGSSGRTGNSGEIADMVGALEDNDGLDGDNDVGSPTGGDGTMDGYGMDDVDPSNDGDWTVDGEGTDGSNDADEIGTTDNCSIGGVMLSGVELGSWTVMVPFKAPKLFNGTRLFPTWDSWDIFEIDDQGRGT